METVKKKPKQLGQILVEQGLITNEQLEEALEKHRNSSKSLGRVLIDLGLIKESHLVRALSEQRWRQPMSCTTPSPCRVRGCRVRRS